MIFLYKCLQHKIVGAYCTFVLVTLYLSLYSVNTNLHTINIPADTFHIQSINNTVLYYQVSAGQSAEFLFQISGRGAEWSPPP